MKIYTATLLAACVANILSAQPPAITPPRIPDSVAGWKTPSKLTSDLLELSRVLNSSGWPQARAFASRRDLLLTESMVTIVVTSKPEADGVIRNRVQTLGGQVEREARGLTRARLPVAALQSLASKDEVLVIRPPMKPVLFQTTSQGVGVIGAEAWHQAGKKGAGVKIAVLDPGFAGYQELMGTELPRIPASRIKSFSGDISGNGVNHGTAVAEVVYDVAPEADLYLVNFSDDVELDNAVQWLIDQKVNIINASWGQPCGGAGDGTGQVNNLVKRAAEAGILWVNASGNYAQRHWAGTFNDVNNDNWHNFSDTESGNPIYMDEGDQLRVCMVWDDWVNKDQDYDLYVWNRSGNSVASSTENQGGPSTHDPVESLSFTASTAGYYYVGVKRDRATRNAALHITAYPPGSECAIEAAVGVESKGILRELRDLRDQVFHGSELGRLLTKAYYRHSREVKGVLLSHPALALEAAAIVNASSPAVSSLLAMQRSQVRATPFRLTAEYVDRIETFLTKVSALGGPELQEDIRGFKNRLALGSAVGMTADQYWMSQGGIGLDTASVHAEEYPDSGYLKYTTAAGSLVPPADSPFALSVGATDWATDALESFSSQGPTSDGRTKPEIAGPDRVCTVTLGECDKSGFAGTSAAAPHAAGAAALVMQQYPHATYSQVRDMLAGRAVDIPPAGIDNQTGFGRLSLNPPTTALLLAGSAIQVDVAWKSQYDGSSGIARPLSVNDRFGYFYFSSRDNPEVFVKVLDFGASSPYLLFYAGLTDLEYTVTFTNLATGRKLSFKKPAGSYAGGANNSDLPHGIAKAFRWSRDGSMSDELKGGRTVSLNRFDEDSPQAGHEDGSRAYEQELLLSKGRVGVSVNWRSQYSGQTGGASPLPQRDEFGYFYFSDPANPEVFVKVLDFGASSPYLLFYAGLTDFEYTLSFRSLRTGQTVSFKKEAGSFNGGADNSSLKQ